MKSENRLFLSPPHLSGEEKGFVDAAFASNWVAPVGPHLNAFEAAVGGYTGTSGAVALSSGTAALHLALQLCGVSEGMDVFCSTFTFAGSAFPITYLKATPVFVDSEANSWNMDPGLLREAIRKRCSCGFRPGAVIVVHLYGQSANMSSIRSVCDEFNIPLIEDAAESLGTYFGNIHTGVLGTFGILSFNGNKIITTSGGGMLLSSNQTYLEKARFLSTQARDPFPWYEHSVIGYNYRMSNIVAAIGCGQILVIEERVAKKRNIYDSYHAQLSEIKGLSFIPRDVYGRSNCWLTCIIVDQDICNTTPEKIRVALEQENIESRPLWKPMHCQPVFVTCPAFINGVSERLFANGLCLPSGTAMEEDSINVVSTIIKRTIE